MKKKKNSAHLSEILIVEDSPTQAKKLADILEGKSYKVLIAKEGKQALSLLKEHRPELIISDVIMPGMNGFELCRKIKSNDALRDIPVMLLTSLSESSDVIKGLECEADNFFTKPYSEDVLLARIRYIQANREIRKKRFSEMGIEIYFGGKKHLITSDRMQIIDLLFSTFENAVEKSRQLEQANVEMEAMQHQLLTLNLELNEKVSDLEKTNEELEKTQIELNGTNQAVERNSEDLRKMVNVMAGRELRMVELKKIIRSLCAQLKEAGMKPVEKIDFLDVESEA